MPKTALSLVPCTQYQDSPRTMLVIKSLVKQKRHDAMFWLGQQQSALVNFTSSHPTISIIFFSLKSHTMIFQILAIIFLLCICLLLTYLFMLLILTLSWNLGCRLCTLCPIYSFMFSFFSYHSCPQQGRQVTDRL